MRYFLSLGSNLGDRKKNLDRALVLLEEKGVKVINRSSLYQTQPVDMSYQPWFYNLAVEVDCEFSPQELLGVIKDIERKMGRKTSRSKAPRQIDIDILLAEDMVIQTQELIVPHPRLEKRNFVLVPLKEISPKTVHPLLKEKIADLWLKSGDTSLVKKIDFEKRRNVYGLRLKI
jgi:2-amino-4-hydroxy-6-hydroxymethyldihydropteridine diphosphokinase